MTTPRPTHLEASLKRDIDLIRSKVKEMAALDKQALEDVLKALKDNNRQLAYAVILRDSRIDDLEAEIDRLCLEFLVRQQPAAMHLRFAYVTIKINLELERIGDYAESIARQVLKVGSLQATPPISSFEHIAGESIPMLDKAVQAYLNEDAALAEQTMAVEEEVDQLKSQLNAELYRLEMEKKIPFESLTPFLTIARRFERVSDQAKNICEEVLYMCTGEYAKHKGTEAFRILFVDDHHACRARMAEAIANAAGLPRLVFSSAGIEPQTLDEQTIRFMQTKGIPIDGRSSRSVEQVPNLDQYQMIIALSEKAKKVFPKPPTKTVSLDWHVQDPSTVQGTPEHIQAAYEETYRWIHTQLQDLTEAILGDSAN